MKDSNFHADASGSAIHQSLEVHARWTHFSPLFTPRHKEILRGVAEGLTNKEIAKALMLAPETVKHHLKRLFSKLSVNSRKDAVTEARRRRIIEQVDEGGGPQNAEALGCKHQHRCGSRAIMPPEGAAVLEGIRLPQRDA